MKIQALAMTLLLTGCASTTPSQGSFDYSKEPDPRQSEYVIGPADSLSITVWKNPDLSRDVIVRPDGTITLPLLGDIRAAGKTPSQLKAEIAKQVGKFVRDEGAAVTVAVNAVNSYSFTVTGKVERPGVFTSTRYMTVLDAIQLAGGPSRFASPEGTQIIRRDSARGTRVIPINYPALVAGTDTRANIVLLSGDQVMVP
jgi:polysaccharide export outer membrane protein